MSICVDCASAPATVTVPAIHSLDAQGKPNGSKELVCDGCAWDRRYSMFPSGAIHMMATISRPEVFGLKAKEF